MPRKRGQPMDRDELKVRRGLLITPTGWDGLERLAEQLGIKSKSELIESIGRGDVKVVLATEENAMGKRRSRRCDMPAA